ncbi:unnamed protein product [Caenorhabditis auriculariae]|uniref:Prefoldin subunit 1 n=1 Tax=Caenorhabditis auriculariae TaxID=2777116 RepID=A0A8S1HML5_9PELO|nr:unnamed protein product [Caenorhabditis auriculariae]
MADEELKKAFQDLQFKTNETRGRISLGETNKKIIYQKQRVSEVAHRTVSEVPDNLPVYRSIGRMFLLTDKPSELERHKQEEKEFKEKIETIDKQRVYLEKGLLEAESNLREMIQSRRS